MKKILRFILLLFPWLLSGIIFKVDLDYLHQLSEKYNKILLEKEAEFYKLCDKYSDKIEAYKMRNPNHKLGSMINIASSTQIAILLYDILGEKPIPKQYRTRYVVS